jgi:polyhydroxyalkanoate synthase
MAKQKKTTNPVQLDHSEPHSQPLSENEQANWGELIEKISQKSKDLMQLYTDQNRGTNTDSGTTVFMPWVVMDAFLKVSSKLMEQPESLVQSSQQLMAKHSALNQKMLDNTLAYDGENPLDHLIHHKSDDRRFKHTHWQNHPYFNYVKQAYLLNSQWMQKMVDDVEGLDHQTAQKASFYTKQMLDAMSPTNFAMTNPEVIHKTMETKGENLLQGLLNFMHDLEKGGGRLSIPKTNLTHFKVGKNIGATPGKVIFQNDLIQLIEYTPMQKSVYETPLLIIPPWINKFYVFDLNKNSFVKQALEQGHQVFIISWINPDKAHSHKTFSDYMHEGSLAALAEVKKVTQAERVNLVSYCLGSILTSCTLGYLAAKGQSEQIESATLLATLVDFSNPGELSVFIDDHQLDALEKRMDEKGYLDSKTMAESFNLLRANSLIWTSYINNYLLCQEFAPFDMLFWNSDSTRMPPQVHSFYLRNLYQKNLLMQAGELEMSDAKINLGDVKTPIFVLSTIDDHIAPWHCGFAARKVYGGPVNFILAGSGHVAGVFNGPETNKYGYWTEEQKQKSDCLPESWKEAATYHEGSWWPEWNAWMQEHTGKKVPAVSAGSRSQILDEAPGSYVMVSDIY